MRDDLDKLPLPKSAKKYARMTSKDLGDDWSKKVDMYMDMAADLTNQSKEGFKNKDASGPVKHAFKESAEQIVARLLEDDELLGQMGRVATRPQELYRLAREALNFVFGEGQGMEAAINAALETVGIAEAETKSGCPLAEFIQDALSDIETGGDVDEAVSYISRGIDEAVPDLETGYKWALMKIFTEEAKGIKAAADEFEAEGGGMPESLGEDDGLLRSMGNVAAKPFKRVKKAEQAFIDAWEDEDIDPRLAFEHSVTVALNTLGVDTSSSEIAEEIAHNLHRLENLNYDVESAEEDVLGAVEHHIPDASSEIKWAIRKVFRSAAAHIKAGYDEMGYDPDDGMPESLGERNYGHGECHAFTAALAQRHPRGEIFGLFDTRYPDEIAHSALRLPDTDTLVDANGQHVGQAAWEAAKRNFDQSENLEWRPMTEERLWALVQGDKQRSVSRAGRHVPRMENEERPYHYETCCVSADGGDISDMVDQAQDVTYDQFMRSVPIAEIFQSGIGYGYYWTPAQAVAAGVDYHEVARNRPLTLKKDWHVSYHRSVYQGKPCFFMVHSAIEYVFVKD